jgi:hypothetical protein
MLALLVATSGALAQSTAHGEAVWSDPPLTYESWAKSGGAMPGAETIVFWEQWTLAEEALLRPRQAVPG